MADDEIIYSWTYSSYTSAYSMITDYYAAAYTSEGKLHYDSKAIWIIEKCFRINVWNANRKGFTGLFANL